MVLKFLFLIDKRYFKTLPIYDLFGRYFPTTYKQTTADRQLCIPSCNRNSSETLPPEIIDTINKKHKAIQDPYQTVSNQTKFKFRVYPLCRLFSNFFCIIFLRKFLDNVDRTHIGTNIGFDIDQLMLQKLLQNDAHNRILLQPCQIT